jgi:putative membrane protein
MTEGRRIGRWHQVFLLLGLVLFAGLVYAAGPAEILRVLRGLGWLTPVIALPYLFTYVVDTLGWWWVLSRCFASPAGNPAPNPRPSQLFAIRAAGEAVNAITPTAYLGGEPLKAWLLRRHGTPLASGMASVLVSKTALMLTQGGFVLLGMLLALTRWRSAIPLAVAAGVGLVLCGLVAVTLIGAQRRGLFSLLLGVSRRLSGRETLLVSWEPDLLALDERLRWFYGSRIKDFLVCCGFHLLGWIAGCLEVYLGLRIMGSPVDVWSALAIEALSGVGKLGAVIVPGSLGVQEGGLVLIFAAFGLGVPVALSFSFLRRGREVLWIGFGLAVLVQRQAVGWLKGRAESRAPRA